MSAEGVKPGLSRGGTWVGLVFLGSLAHILGEGSPPDSASRRRYGVLKKITKTEVKRVHRPAISKRDPKDTITTCPLTVQAARGPNSHHSQALVDLTQLTPVVVTTERSGNSIGLSPQQLSGCSQIQAPKSRNHELQDMGVLSLHTLISKSPSLCQPFCLFVSLSNPHPPPFYLSR